MPEIKRKRSSKARGTFFSSQGKRKQSQFEGGCRGSPADISADLSDEYFLGLGEQYLSDNIGI